MSFSKKGRSILIVSMLLLGGLITVAALVPTNVVACNMNNLYVNGTKVYGPDGNNGNTVATVNAPGSPNYVWEYGKSYYYIFRLTMTPGCGNKYECQYDILAPKPSGWTLGVFDDDTNEGKAKGTNIDGVRIGNRNTPTDGMSGNVDYQVKFTVTPPASGAGQDITIKMQVYSMDSACNDDDYVTVVFTGTIGPPNVLPDITLNNPTGGETFTNGQMNVAWTATDADAIDPANELTMSLQYQNTGSMTWVDFATGLKNDGATSSGSYDWDCTNIDDGDYYIRAKVTDARQGVDTSATPTPVTINNPDLPEVEITNPSGYDSYSGEIDIQWTATDNDEDDANLAIMIQYTDDIVYGAWYTISMDEANDGSYVWDISEMEDGNNYMLKVIAKDSSGLTGEFITPNKFIINNENGPVVKLSYPSAGVTITGKKSVYWSATDDEDADQLLKIDLAYTLDDGATWTDISTMEKNDGEYAWDTVGYPDSETYKLRVYTKDSNDMEGFAVSEAFAVFNNDDPVIAFTYPTEAEILEGEEVNIAWTATDEETAADELKVTLEYKMGEDAWTTIDGAYDVKNLGEFYWDTTELQDGDYNLRLTVKDTHGAMVNLVSANFSIYNPDEPVIDLLSPKAGQLLRGKIDIKWDAYDEDMDQVLKIDIEYSSDGTKWNNVAKEQENDGEYTWDTKSAPDGNTYVRVIAKDDLHQVIAESGQFRIDNSVNTAPEVTINAPNAKDLEIKGTYKIEWTATDLEKDELYINIQYSKDKSTWVTIEGAESISNSGSFNWDTTQVADGKYYIRIIANDGKLENDPPTTSKSFNVNNKGGVIVVIGDDDDDDVDGGEDTQGLSSGAMIGIGGLIVFLILAAIVVVIVLVVVLGKKKKPAEEQPRQEAQAATYSGAATPYADPYAQQQQSTQMGAGYEAQQVGGAAATQDNYYLPPGQDQNQNQW